MLPNSRLKYVLLTILIVSVLFISGCAVLVPQFSHQGQLLDGDGNPVADGDYSVMYRLYHQASGGTAVYTETKTIAVDNSLFTTSVGPSSDMPAELFANQVWMELTVDGEVLTPRQRLEGAPFAFSLAPGAVVQGPQDIERSFATFDDTGAAMTVLNTNATATGGHGLIVLNQAAATGNDRGKVAALMAIAAGGDIDPGDTPADSGAYGAILRSESYRGIYASGGRETTTVYYAGVFDSGSGILITGGGSCVGCALAYPAYNIGSGDIRPGEFVAAAGVLQDEDLAIPVMQVRKAAAGDAVIGVATGAMVRNPVSDFYGAATGGFEVSGGTAGAGDFLSVVVQGLVEAKVGLASELQIGDGLTLNENGMSAAIVSEPSAGRLMSDVDKDGLAWVMLSGQ